MSTQRSRKKWRLYYTTDCRVKPGNDMEEEIAGARPAIIRGGVILRLD